MQTPYERLRARFAIEDGITLAEAEKRYPDWRFDAVSVADYPTWKQWLDSVK